MTQLYFEESFWNKNEAKFVNEKYVRSKDICLIRKIFLWW